MTEIIIPLWLVAIVFLIVAMAYSSVGLGGGSSYIALMVVLGFGALSIPLISLVLSLLVTSFGSYNFIRRGHLRPRLLLPFILTSMPMAWLGGYLQIPKAIFHWILLISLVVVVLRIYGWRNTSFRLQLTSQQKIVVSLSAGGILGLLAGIVGIGGGIYLVPLIIILGLGSVREAAACGAVFIWLNSLVGLLSRLQFNYIDLTPYLPLLLAVMAGGAMGSFLGSSRLSTDVMEKILGSVVIVAIFFLGRAILTA
jgi:uncharacterized membrane protein YfcA